MALFRPFLAIFSSTTRISFTNGSSDCHFEVLNGSIIYKYLNWFNDFGFWRKTIENFFMRITFFPKLQRIDMYCKKYTYIHNQIFYCFCFCHWCHSIPLHQSTKIRKSIWSCDELRIYNSFYFVSFCGFSCIWYSFVS